MDTRKLSEIALILVGFALILFLLEKFQSFLRPLTIAVLLSLLFTPTLRRSKKDKVKAGLKFAGTALLLLAVVIGLGASFTNADLSGLALNEDFFSGISISFAGKTVYLSNVVDTNRIMNVVGTAVGAFATGITAFVSEFFLIILFIAFVLPAMNIWIRNMTRKMKEKEKREFRKVIHDMEDGIQEYIKAKTIISLGTAFTSLVVMMLFGVEYFLIFSVVIFILNYIPSIGSIIAVISVLLLQVFAMGLGVKFILLAVLLTSIQMLFGNYIEPKFTGKKLNISPLIVLISLFFWGAIWGVAGMLFSVPLTLAIKIILEHNETTKGLARYIS
ncbi:MAG: AI-2E family transporter [Candidatus Woesearchaeota archaeon]|nr:AI-2E family transporter [Candidatus Woesearchaeota archaeon]